jgi:hypothetical protein
MFCLVRNLLSLSLSLSLPTADRVTSEIVSEGEQASEVGIIACKGRMARNERRKPNTGNEIGLSANVALTLCSMFQRRDGDVSFFFFSRLLEDRCGCRV